MSPGREDDVFDPSKRAGSASVRTDGTYVWKDMLAYYVENYDVELPAEFEAHRERNDWTVPEVPDKLALALPSSSVHGTTSQAIQAVLKEVRRSARKTSE